MEHVVEVNRNGEFTILAKCSCGAWVEATSDGKVVIKCRFKKLCTGTDLFWRRMKVWRD